MVVALSTVAYVDANIIDHERRYGFNRAAFHRI